MCPSFWLGQGSRWCIAHMPNVCRAWWVPMLPWQKNGNKLSHIHRSLAPQIKSCQCWLSIWHTVLRHCGSHRAIRGSFPESIANTECDKDNWWLHHWRHIRSCGQLHYWWSCWRLHNSCGRFNRGWHPHYWRWRCSRAFSVEHSFIKTWPQSRLYRWAGDCHQDPFQGRYQDWYNTHASYPEHHESLSGYERVLKWLNHCAAKGQNQVYD